MAIGRMRQRILDKVYPEVALFTRGERDSTAFADVWKRAWRRPDVLVPPLAGFLVGIIGMLLLPSLDVPVEYRGAVRIGLQLLFPIAFLVSMLRYRKHVQRGLRRLLNQSGPRICVECGYALRQSQSRTCPECGSVN